MATEANLLSRLAVRPERRRGQARKGGAAAIGQRRARQSHESQRAARAAAAGGRWSQRARGSHFLRGARRLPADPPRGLGRWRSPRLPLGACALCDVRARAGPSPVSGARGERRAQNGSGGSMLCVRAVLCLRASLVCALLAADGDTESVLLGKTSDISESIL